MNNLINPKPDHRKRNLAIILTPIIVFIILIFPIPVDQPVQPMAEPIYSETLIPSFDPAMENNQLFVSKNQDNGTHFRITIREGATSEGILLP